MGAILAVAFYSLFFSAHLKFQNTPIYVRDGLIFGAASKSVFMDLTTERQGAHSQISVLHPAFTLIHQPLAQLGKVQILPDPQISAGGCRIDTDFGNVDQRIETQLDRIAQELGGRN